MGKVVDGQSTIKTCRCAAELAASLSSSDLALLYCSRKKEYSSFKSPATFSSSLFCPETRRYFSSSPSSEDLPIFIKLKSV